MTDTSLTRALLAVCLCATVVAGSVPATATASAADGSLTADEALQQLQGFEDEPAFQTYSEFEVLRSQAVTAVQVGTFTDADRKRMQAVLTVLTRFVDAYDEAQNGSRVDSLALANETAAAIDALRAAGGTQYATLARLGLERFYRVQGDALYERARTAENTSTQLRYLDAAAQAFKAGGAASRYSQVSAEESRVRATFRADRQRMLRAMNQSAAFLNRCGESCTSPTGAVASLGVGVFGQYQNARAAAADARTAVRLAEKHGLQEAAARASSLSESIAAARLALALAGSLLGFVYAGLLGTVAMLVAIRVATWAQDVDGSQVGRVVPREPVEVADQ
ncbi:hypothetical protein [Halobaculum sp. D14]|uniref:hypothetical protein n=1 Tax=Halobaculum sp. D14 TaxID=3421642 RepID=UPI003EB93654